MSLTLIPLNMNLQIMKYRYIWGGISLFLILASIGMYFVKGPKWGIDFLGGAEVHIRLNSKVSADEVRSHLEAAKLDQLLVQEIVTDQTNQTEFLIKVGTGAGNPEEIGPMVSKVVKDKYQDSEVLRVDTVGPTAGKDLRRKATLALFWAWIAIFIYVLIRFDLRYAPGAVIALIHDALLALGFNMFFDREFSVQTVAALLTIIGFSVNDTIIVYDRIRENTLKHPMMKLMDVIDLSVNETLSRTLLTSTTVLMVCFALIFLGGSVIYDFALTMTVGFVVGVYSSVFVASTFIIFMDKFLGKTDSAQSKNKPVKAS